MNYSIVIPIYSDGYLAYNCCTELIATFSSLIPKKNLEHYLEIIFVNDGSKDSSLSELLYLKKQFKCVKVIDLSRNFGQHAAIASGFHVARGLYVLRMNVDLQDHPNQIPKLINEMMSGEYDLVTGQYAIRNSPWANRITSFLYFSLFRILTGIRIPQNTSPLRIMNRTFINAYNSLTEKSRFPQGLDQYLGFRHKYIEIEHHSRVDGKSSYNFMSRSRLAFSGILYFSDYPLKLIGYFGLSLSVFGLGLGVAVLIQKLTSVNFLPGYASIAATLLLGFGIQIGFMGILGLYVANIFKEVQNRPLYLIREIY